MWSRWSADLFTLFVRGGVVGDFEVVQVQYVLHLIIVSTSLANNDSHIKQKDMSVQQENKLLEMIITTNYCKYHNSDFIHIQ